MGMQISSGKGKGAQPNINVTPLVDVVLVLLIIFMVVLPNVQDAKTIKMVEALTAPKNKMAEGTVILTMTKEGDLFMDKSYISPGQAFDFIKKRREEDPEVPVLLRADAGIEYKKVRTWLQEAQELGLVKLDLAVQVRKN